MAEDIGFGRLPRGAKILWERVAHYRTLTLGFFFATGSRFDPPGKAGTAHLVEHMVFKGTKNHTAVSLARLVDRVGGDLNAWTDREEIAFTCTVPAEAWRIAVEALSELCFLPRFPLEEFDREKEVIRNEILQGQDDPEEVSYDYFLQSISPGDWSRPVAGTEETLAGISWEDVVQWWRDHGDPANLTVAVSGPVEVGLIETDVAMRLEQAPFGPHDRLPVKGVFEPRSRFWTKKAPFQMAQVLGSYAFAAPQDARQASILQIFSLLWGENMSSRLFQNLRETLGLCYSITSQVFDAERVWGLQFFVTCAPENLTPVLQALGTEIRRLNTDPPSKVEWEEARFALRGSVILAAEKSEYRASRLWRQWETFGRLVGVEETLAVLDVPVSDQEKNSLLSALVSQIPSLLVWGKMTGKLLFPEPWTS